VAYYSLLELTRAEKDLKKAYELNPLGEANKYKVLEKWGIVLRKLGSRD